MIKALYEYEVGPLSDEDSQLLIQILTANFKSIGIPPELKQSPCYSIIESRNPHKADELVIGLVSMFCDSPGRCVQWAHTLYSIGDNITLKQFLNKFPLGFPTDESYRKAWEDQKDKGVNMLDDLGNW